MRIHVEADALHGLRGHHCFRVQKRDVAGHEQHDLLALVARIRQQFLGLGDVGLAIGLRTRQCLGRATANEETAAIGQAHVQRIAHGRHEALLVYCGQQGLAHLRIVEGRLGLVHCQKTLVRAEGSDLHVAVGAQWCDVVRRHLFDDVDLAALERCDGAVGVGQVKPFDALEVAFLAAGQAVCRLAARHVVGVAHEHHLVARHPFVAFEDEGPRAKYLRQGGGGWHLRDALGQDYWRKT
ncbi:hypothetical protein D9M72_478610 [compost metagenome]